MHQAELEQLDDLLHKFRNDNQIIPALSILEQQAIEAASETICSLIRKHLKPAEQRLKRVFL
jgi:hypothetical protein